MNKQVLYCVPISLLREWYSYHFPELVKIVSDNTMYAKVAHFIKNRKDLTDDSLEPLEEIVMDSAKAKAILDASRSSMGDFFLYLQKCRQSGKLSVGACIVLRKVLDIRAVESGSPYIVRENKTCGPPPVAKLFFFL